MIPNWQNINCKFRVTNQIRVQKLKSVLVKSSMPCNFPKETLDIGRDNGESNGGMVESRERMRRLNEEKRRGRE